MIGLEDRRSLAQDIDIANTAGARLHLACSTAGIDLRTLQRWKAAKGLQTGDGRPSAVHPTPGHAPVSYTHLDVYKRQVLPWEDCVDTPSKL